MDQGSAKTFTPAEVREMVKRDVHTALLLLDAIYRDQDCINAVGDYLYGRYQNSKHREELKKQTELDLSAEANV